MRLHHSTLGVGWSGTVCISLHVSLCVCVFFFCYVFKDHITTLQTIYHIHQPLAHPPQLTRRHEVTGAIKRLDWTIVWLCVSIVTQS